MSADDVEIPKMWAVVNIDERDDGERLYWSNDQGWVAAEDADTFFTEDLTHLRLPLSGAWVPMDWEPDTPLAMRTMQHAVVHLLVDAENETEAMDYISEMLGDRFFDWGYAWGPFGVPRPLDVLLPYSEGDFIAALAREG